ncbi:MAG: hypothetical protein HY553_10095 [Elusimicrobia bacterium]|nr:hypothetical protein [Elusimicrobiota bacterium]
MEPFGDLRARVSDRSARLAVIGLGYVGLSVAACFAAARFRVIGLDRDAGRIAALRAGRLPLAHSEPGLEDLVVAGARTGALDVTTEHGDLSGADVFIVAVDTPIDDRKRPDTSNLRAACDTIARHARPGSLVVVESTVAPGTMRGVVAPAFARAPAVAIAHCPERVRPGRLLANLRGMERLVGVDDAEVGALCVELYSTILHAPRRSRRGRPPRP